MPRPCTHNPPQYHIPFRPKADCIYCYLWFEQPCAAVVRRWKGLDRITVGSGCDPNASAHHAGAVCDFEEKDGDGRPYVREFAACGCESKHVRVCTKEYNLCTRGFTQGTLVQPCYRCADRTVNGVKVGPVRSDLTPLRIVSDL